MIGLIEESSLENHIGERKSRHIDEFAKIFYLS